MIFGHLGGGGWAKCPFSSKMWDFLMDVGIFSCEIQMWKFSQNGPGISDAANFGKLYLRAQKELDGKPGIYDQGYSS